MHPTLTQPSSTLRATMHMQKKRKNTSFRLQRELCRSRLPLFLVLISVYLFLSFRLSLFFSSSHHCPSRVNEEPAGSPYREVPQMFSQYCLLLNPFLSFPSYSFFLYHFYFFVAAGFTGSLLLLLKLPPLSYFSFIFDMKTWKSVYLP